MPRFKQRFCGRFCVSRFQFLGKFAQDCVKPPSNGEFPYPFLMNPCRR